MTDVLPQPCEPHVTSEPPGLELQIFDEAIVELAEQAVDAIEQLERIRRDERTTSLLVSARRFLGDVEVYFDLRGAR